MDDDIKKPEEEQPESEGASVSNNKAKSSKLALNFSLGSVATFVVASALLIALAIVFSLIKVRDPAPNTTALASGLHCSTWLNAPVGYQKAIEAAANKACNGQECLRPALLGAIFLSEHGDNWPSWGPEAYKNDFLVKHPTDFKQYSPFQFESRTWKKYSSGAPEKDMMDFDIAATAAAKFLQSILNNAGLEINTEKDTDIKCVGGGYNSGPDDCKQWAKKGFPNVAPPTTHPANYDGSTRIFTTNDYDLRTWRHFQELNQGCISYASNVNSILADTYSNPKWDKSFMAKPELSAWLTARKSDPNKKLVPTGWTLHWTGGSSPEGAYRGMSGRDPKVYVHFIVDYDGTVYQLMPLNLKQAGSGTGTDANGLSANDFTLGIEIVGVGENDLENHPDQKTAVVNLIKEVNGKLNMPNLVKGNKENFENKVGVFGHFQTGGGTCRKNDATGKTECDYIIGCSSKRKTDPGKNYLKEIWDLVGATGTGCGV